MRRIRRAGGALGRKSRRRRLVRGSVDRAVLGDRRLAGGAGSCRALHRGATGQGHHAPGEQGTERRGWTAKKDARPQIP